jgi:hypothetical protein
VVIEAPLSALRSRDEVLGNREVVVKNLALSCRACQVCWMAVCFGAVVLIYNP